VCVGAVLLQSLSTADTKQYIRCQNFMGNWGHGPPLNMQKCCKQMHFASTQCSNMQLLRGCAQTPLGELTALPQILWLILYGDK